MQEHCVSCHRPQGIASFPLLSYENAAARPHSIKDAVVSRRMPHGISMRLETGCAEPDTFHGPRQLTQFEIDTIATWVDIGFPEGDPSDLPEPREFIDGEWAMGTPDYETANAPGGFTLPPSINRDIFRRFVVAPDFESERFITGFEALPDTAGGAGLAHVVHHVTLFVNPGAEALEQEEEFASSNPEVPGPGFEGDFDYPAVLVGMWFPGSAPLLLPEGLGVRVPPGAALVFEVHYSPNQEVIVDATRIGLKLADQVEREITVGLVKNTEFTVPAGDPAFVVNAERSFEEPATLHSITPHQHQLGTDFRVVVNRPGHDPLCLADVAWDFEHQGTYQLQRPLELPAGTSIEVECIYNNSAENPNQFNDPPQDIPFGTVADQEMCQLTVGTGGGGAPPPAGHPELVEVFADAIGDDATSEWIKLRNPTDQPIDLSGYAFGWGGEDYTYGTLDLSGSLAPGECVIIGAVPGELDGLDADFVPDLQNAGAVADAIGLFTGAAAAIGADSVPVDAVLYGGTNSNDLIDETGEKGAVDVGNGDPGESIRKIGGVWSVGEPVPAECP
jgi:hypothetical protein